MMMPGRHCGGLKFNDETIEVKGIIRANSYGPSGKMRTGAGYSYSK